MSNKLKVIVHENDEITVQDGRGYPNTCNNCRFSGWLTQYEFDEHKTPRTCLFHSGGADPKDGDRVRFDACTSFYDDKDVARNWRDTYPLCHQKNHDGACEDYVKAKPLPWWKKLFGLTGKARRKMRL